MRRGAARRYDKALYLDADAFPCASFAWLRGELGPALERYDVLATHSSMRRGFPHAFVAASSYASGPRLLLKRAEKVAP